MHCTHHQNNVKYVKYTSAKFVCTMIIFNSSLALCGFSNFFFNFFGLKFRSTTCKNGLLSSVVTGNNNTTTRQRRNNYINILLSLGSEPTLNKSANQKNNTTNFYFPLKKKKYYLLASCWFVFGFPVATKFETHILF